MSENHDGNDDSRGVVDGGEASVSVKPVAINQVEIYLSWFFMCRWFNVYFSLLCLSIISRVVHVLKIAS